MIRAELKVVDGKHAGKVIPLPKGKFLIGREKDCHLRPSSELISRHHCVFNLDDYTVRLRDLGSTNGTQVNEKRLQGETVLSVGDRVVIGPLHFEILMTEVADSAAPQPQSMHDSGMLSDPGHDHTTETAYELKMDPKEGQQAAQQPPVQPSPATETVALTAEQMQAAAQAQAQPPQTEVVTAPSQSAQPGPLMPSGGQEARIPAPPVRLPDPEETGVKD